MTGPLDGVKVLEMASVITGPFAGMLLSDLGAEVVKVEMPGTGDVFRKWASDDAELSPPFAAFNRAKKSVTIDVHTPGGVDSYLKLAATVDVVVANFRPGVLDRMGVGYDAVNAVNPSVVYCEISGVGATGPRSHLPTYDAIAQADSGLWSQLTELDDPEPIGPALADQLAGLYAAYGVLGALFHRARTGKGQRVDVSMLGASVGFQTSAVAGLLMQGTIEGRTERARRSQSYAFVASDHLPLAIHLSTPDKFWHGLADAVERPDLLTDRRFTDKKHRIAHYDELHEELAGAFKSRPRAEWLDRLSERDVPAAPINTIAEALEDPQARLLGMVRRFGNDERAVDLVGFPVAYGCTPCEPGDRPPSVGEHTDEVLAGLGLSRAEIDALRSDSAI